MNFYNNFTNKHLKIAHRGYRSIRPENTLSAFEASIGKFDFIELDIQVTKDLELVVFHDYKLERTTNINKNKNFPFNGSYNIYDYTLEELRLLDIQNWFIKDDPFGKIKKGKVTKEELKSLTKQAILTVDDILLFAQTNNIALNIELKDCDCIEDELFVSKLLSCIDKHNIKIPLLISSFNDNYLKIIKEKSHNIATAINIENKHPEDLINYVNSLNVQSYHCAVNIATPSVVKRLIDAGFVVNVFTVNDEKKASELFDMGIKSIFTDYCLECTS
ncbi:MAG: glycerophosphodiester phosphodiesterase family protein [Campylobacterota bacterium]|nr:glycerophosphodiester phosphodiesterase family protein [Campylobacterota bacterium]